MAQGRGPGGHFSRGFMTEEEKANQPKVTKALLKRIVSYLRPYSGRLALVPVCIAAASFFSLLPSILTGKIIDEGLVKLDLNALVKYIVLSLAVTLGANLIGVAESYINTWIAQHITYDMRNQMYAHLLSLSSAPVVGTPVTVTSPRSLCAVLGSDARARNAPQGSGRVGCKYT